MHAPETAQRHENLQARDHHQSNHERLVVRLLERNAVHERPEVEPDAEQDGERQNAAAEHPVEGHVQRHVLHQLVDVRLRGFRRAAHIVCRLVAATSNSTVPFGDARTVGKAQAAPVWSVVGGWAEQPECR